MNPEEGNLRPQILDRFGLRVFVHGLTEPKDRLEAYHRVRAYQQNPRLLASQFSIITQQARLEIEQARQILPQVSIPDEVAQFGIQLIQNLEIDSLRAEITLFESARALAASDGRLQVQLADLKQVSTLALRLRHSPFMQEYLKIQIRDDQQIQSTMNDIIPNPS